MSDDIKPARIKVNAKPAVLKSEKFEVSITGTHIKTPTEEFFIAEGGHVFLVTDRKGDTATYTRIDEAL